MTQPGHPFFIEILAPSGLEGIQALLGECKLGVSSRTSGFNGQEILVHDGKASDLEFAMDPSTRAVMFGSGHLDDQIESAWQRLTSLSLVLQKLGLPHWMGMDEQEVDSSRFFCFRCSIRSTVTWDGV